jgi:hypothetical protein
MSQVPPAFASMGLGQHGLGGGRPQGRFAPAGRRPAAVLDRHPRPAPFGSQAGTKKRPRSAEPRNMTSSRAKRLSPMTEPVANHYAAQEGVTYVPGPKCYLCARLNPRPAMTERPAMTQRPAMTEREVASILGLSRCGWRHAPPRRFRRTCACVDDWGTWDKSPSWSILSIGRDSMARMPGIRGRHAGSRASVGWRGRALRRRWRGGRRGQGRGRTRRLEYRSGRGRRAAVHQRQGQRQRHEDGGEDPGCPGQQVRRPPPGHERPHALGRSDAQPAALAALDQNNANQRQGDEQVDDQQDGAQDRVPKKARPGRTDVEGPSSPAIPR